MSSTLTGDELKTTPPLYHDALTKVEAQEFPPNGRGSLVQFEAKEVSQIYEMCDLLRTKVKCPDASMWDQNEIAELQNLYDMLQVKLNGPNNERLRLTDKDALNGLGIQYGRQLRLKSKDNISLRIGQTNKLGETQHWFADGLSHHLSLLKSVIPDEFNAPLTESLVNAYFYRVAAMLAPDTRMVLKPEQADATLPLSKKPGTMRWIAMATSSLPTAYGLLMSPYLTQREDSSKISVLFVAEREPEDNIFSTVRDMHKWAGIMGKSIIRGAVTDGFAWTFILLKLNQRGGGVYRISNDVYIGDSLSKFELALIPGILAHWMIHSHQDLGDDDYFENKIW